MFKQIQTGSGWLSLVVLTKSHLWLLVIRHVSSLMKHMETGRVELKVVCNVYVSFLNERWWTTYLHTCAKAADDLFGKQWMWDASEFQTPRNFLQQLLLKVAILWLPPPCWSTSQTMFQNARFLSPEKFCPYACEDLHVCAGSGMRFSCFSFTRHLRLCFEEFTLLWKTRSELLFCLVFACASRLCEWIWSGI